MSALPPSRANLIQLRHQAKDLLRAHQRQEPDVCARLRRLRQFARCEDAAILAAELALHEAQYVVAMEYGFESWNALKKHVESQLRRPAEVHRDAEKVVIPGLEKLPIGGDGEHENSVIACLAGAMQAMGEDYSYEYLMGASGAAFRVQHAWCPSSAHAECGYNCTHPAAAAAGYAVRWIEIRYDKPPVAEGMTRAAKAIAVSIDVGMPALMSSEECSLIVGYTADGRWLVRRYRPKKDEAYVPTGQWPWVVGIIEHAGRAPARRAVAIASLRTAVMLATTAVFGNYASGFAALEQWADELEDESRLARLDKTNWQVPALANGHAYTSLHAARLAAERYLYEVAEEFEEPMRQQLVALAGRYGQIREVTGRKYPGFDCPWKLMPWHLKSLANWTGEVHRTQAAVLREVLNLEKQAIGEVQQALAFWDAQQAPAQQA